MRGAKRLRQALMRSDRLLAAGVIAIPFVALACLGFIWLGERDLLIPFIAASAALGLMVWITRAFVRSNSPFAPASGSNESEVRRDDLSVLPNPDWSALERAAFERARTEIAAKTREPVEWAALPTLGQEVVNLVAREIGGDRASFLDFTAPEALLLLERVAGRYRDLLKKHVPFSDQVRLSTLHVLWRNRQRGLLIYHIAKAGYRTARIAWNPPTGIMREIEQLIAGGNGNSLTTQMAAESQAMLLEEAAHAAVDLYSGNLRFSDAELLENLLAETDADRARAAEPLGPLRIVVVGQTS